VRGASVRIRPVSDARSFKFFPIRLAQADRQIGIVAQAHVVAPETLDRAGTEHRAHARKNVDKIHAVAPKLIDHIRKHVLYILKPREQRCVRISHQNAGRRSPDAFVFEKRQHLIDRIGIEIAVGIEHKEELASSKHQCNVEVCGLPTMIRVGEYPNFPGTFEGAR